MYRKSRLSDQHAAPRRRRRLHAEAEKADGRLGHDELRELQARHHDDRRRDVGQHVAEQQPRLRPTPSAAAAWTKSRCFTESTSPRTTRAYTTQPAAERLRMMLRRPSPTMALMVSASRMNGKRELHVGDAHEHGRRASARRSRRRARAARRRPPSRTTVQHADEQRQARAVAARARADRGRADRCRADGPGVPGRLEALRRSRSRSGSCGASQGAASAASSAASVRPRPSHFFTEAPGPAHRRRTRGSSQP